MRYVGCLHVYVAVTCSKYNTNPFTPDRKESINTALCSNKRSVITRLMMAGGRWCLKCFRMFKGIRHTFRISNHFAMLVMLVQI